MSQTSYKNKEGIYISGDEDVIIQSFAGTYRMDIFQLLNEIEDRQQECANGISHLHNIKGQISKEYLEIINKDEITINNIDIVKFPDIGDLESKKSKIKELIQINKETFMKTLGEKKLDLFIEKINKVDTIVKKIIDRKSIDNSLFKEYKNSEDFYHQTILVLDAINEAIEELPNETDDKILSLRKKIELIKKDANFIYNLMGNMNNGDRKKSMSKSDDILDDDKFNFTKKRSSK